MPEDSGWTVTLYYRGSGDAKFIAKVMKWRYKELVARIPALDQIRFTNSGTEAANLALLWWRIRVEDTALAEFSHGA